MEPLLIVAIIVAGVAFVWATPSPPPRPPHFHDESNRDLRR